MSCPGCKRELNKLKESLVKKSDGKYSIRGVCPECDRWIKWVPYKDSDLVFMALDQYYERSK